MQVIDEYFTKMSPRHLHSMFFYLTKGQMKKKGKEIKECLRN